MKIILLLLISFTVSAENLRIAVSEIDPCVIVNDGVMSGFSIDLVNGVAKSMNRKPEYIQYSFIDKMNAVKEGKVDIGIGCISQTSLREREVDFTVPVLESGFLTLSKPNNSVIPMFSDRSKERLGILLLMCVIFAHVIWLAERGRDAFNDRYFPGIFESVYFTIVTMSTVGYGDFSPRKWLGRISAVLLIFTGVSAFGIIVGEVSNDVNTTSAKHQVNDISDLRGINVATKQGTSSHRYLTKNGIVPITYETIDESYDALKNDVVDVVFYDAPSIKYQANMSELISSNTLINRHYYAFVLHEESNLIDDINESILRLKEDGFHDVIRDRWF